MEGRKDIEIAKMDERCEQKKYPRESKGIKGRPQGRWID